MVRTLESGTLDALLRPQGGLVGHASLFRPSGDEPRLRIRTVQLGDVAQIWPHIRKPDGQANLTGGGVGLNDAEALVPALAEGLERYCASVYKGEQFISETADALGADALDLDTIPRCSKTELSHARCPLAAPDKKAPIRWVRSLSLLDGRIVWVPVVMVYLYAGFATPAERICLPISTGCAAHVTFERAILRAILEVIERDAISIAWLQKVPLPRIEVDQMPELLEAYWKKYEMSSKELEYIFFDATTDLAVPTVYALQIARANRRLTTLVSCCTAVNPVEALVKVIRDLAGLRIAFRDPRPGSQNWDDFKEVHDGALYMARAEQAHAFAFLLQGPTRRPLSKMAALAEDGDDRHALENVLERLRRNGLDAYAVDLSTDEALRSGVRVVRVLIPGLQPIGLQYRARYLGHPRLYEAPRKMGYPVYPEEQLNRWPQPFA